MIINGMAGGGALSMLEVIRVAAVGNIPSSSPNGKLYIITDTAITTNANGILWTGSLPTLRADGSALQNGDVCILGGTQSQVPVQVLPGYYVYPRQAYQRVSGAWAQKSAKIRYGGALVDLAYYLYKDGAKPLGAWTIISSAGEVNNTLMASCSSTVNGAVALPVLINFTDINALHALHRLALANTNGNRLVVCTSITDIAAIYNTTAAYVTLPGVGVWTDTSLNVSALVGNYYVAMLSYYSIGNTAKGSQAAQIWFE